MKRAYFVILFIILAATAIAQTGGAISITKPASGAKVQQNSVTVAYALTNPAVSASGTPTFEIRLDSRDPVTTTATDHTFTGVTPGPHTITVQLVDANGTPVNGGKAEVHFTVVRSAARLHAPQGFAAALRMSPTDIRVASASSPQPVNSAGALPLISVIGFGVLLGGIASAMKSR